MRSGALFWPAGIHAGRTPVHMRNKNFKSITAFCDEYGLKMNIVLEALMNDFSSGNYSINVSKSGITIKKEDWKEKIPISWSNKKQGNFPEMR